MQFLKSVIKSVFFISQTFNEKVFHLFFTWSDLRLGGDETLIIFLLYWQTAKDTSQTALRYITGLGHLHLACTYG